MFFAVHKGFQQGVFESEDEMRACVDGFAGAVYDTFATLAEAQTFCASGVRAASSGVGAASAEVENPHKVEVAESSAGPRFVPRKHYQDQGLGAFFGNCPARKPPKAAARARKPAPARGTSLYAFGFEDGGRGETLVPREGSEVVVYVAGHTNTRELVDRSGSGVHFADDAVRARAGGDRGLPVRGARKLHHAELAGVLHALEALSKDPEVRERRALVRVCVASTFLLGACGHKLQRWKMAGWRSKAGNRVKHTALLQRIDALVHGLRVQLQSVPASSAGLQRAVALARRATAGDAEFSRED